MKWKEAENANEIQQKAKQKQKTGGRHFSDEWKVAEKKENKTKKVKIKIAVLLL